MLITLRLLYLLSVLASSGIDYDVKIWCPLEQDSQFDEVKSAEVSIVYFFEG